MLASFIWLLQPQGWVGKSSAQDSDRDAAKMMHPGTHRCQDSALLVILRISNENESQRDLYYGCGL